MRLLHIQNPDSVYYTLQVHIFKIFKFLLCYKQIKLPKYNLGHI